MDNKASLLLVDDDESLLKTMSLIFERKGYAVSTVKNGSEAVAAVKQQPFDLILMDVIMPLMDGVAANKEIKRIRPEAVVIMMTAYAVEELVQEALADGAFGVLHKPVDFDKLIGVVEGALGVKAGALILLVEDDPGVATTLKNILARQGYEVGVAQTGEEAVIMAQAQAYDILFVDVMLPTINGLETYLTIKAAHPEVVAIMMTGHRQEVADLVAQALKHAAYTCLYKPFDMEVVLTLIEEILTRKKQAASLDASDKPQ